MARDVTANFRDLVQMLPKKQPLSQRLGEFRLASWAVAFAVYLPLDMPLRP